MLKILKSKNIKKNIILSFVVITLFTSGFAICINLQSKSQRNIMNNKINSIIDKVIEKYPYVTEEEILEILNNNETSNNNILAKYGYDNDIADIQIVQRQIQRNKKINVVFIAIFGITLFGIYLEYIIKQERKIQDINEYIKQLNNKNYILKIEENDDGELSKLRNELYKTMVILKETAEINKKEKENLSVAIADISHQLKTPLTSIMVMLDNIQDNPDMEPELRKEFLQDISKQINWINSLVVSLLKIAKFDAGIIKMDNKEIKAKELINAMISNLGILIELKEINVIEKLDENAIFIGDFKWQLEALTNILKNAIEYSNPKSKIYVIVENTSVFLKITIKDEGQGMDKEDKKHIFERFYKAKNSCEESIGIGLPLAKTIIEKNNGYIKVESELGKGTKFEIKYIK